MTLQVLSWVAHPGPEEAELLIKLCRQLNDDTTPEWILLEHAANRAQIWRCMDGLVVTQLHTNPDGRELFVLGIVGHGIIGALEDAASDLKEVGKSFECSAIGGHVSRPGLKKLYDALGAEPVYTYYKMEIE